MKNIIILLVILLIAGLAEADEFTLYINAVRIDSADADSNYSTSTETRVYDGSAPNYGRGQTIGGDSTLTDSVALGTQDTLQLFLHFLATDSDSIKFTVYGIKREVVFDELTFLIYSTGNNWETAGAAGANDRGGLVTLDTCAIVEGEPDTLDGGWFVFDLIPDSMAIYDHIAVSPIEDSDDYTNCRFHSDSTYIRGVYTAGEEESYMYLNLGQ